MIKTPYYLIDESKLLNNLKRISYIQEKSGAKALLALKCFATFGVFPLMQKYLSGSTTSSLYEIELAHKHFKGEIHAYSVAFADDEITRAVELSDKIIFNSISQLERFESQSNNIKRGLRVNPQVSVSGFDLANPTRAFSRLGEVDVAKVEAILPKISGVMIHNNCENADFVSFANNLKIIEEKYQNILSKLEWISFGGGIHFVADNYPIDDFCLLLKDFSEKYGVQIYLEPGEASITNCASLETSVLDIVQNEKKIAIVDSSIEAHMLDLLIYRLNAKINNEKGDNSYIIAGKSCLAGDIFGEYSLQKPLQIGDRVSFDDVAGYTMVKKNWFNGVKMPKIVIKRLNGKEEIVQETNFSDYEQNFGNLHNISKYQF